MIARKVNKFLKRLSRSCRVALSTRKSLNDMGWRAITFSNVSKKSLLMVFAILCCYTGYNIEDSMIIMMLMMLMMIMMKMMTMMIS